MKKKIKPNILIRMLCILGIHTWVEKDDYEAHAIWPACQKTCIVCGRTKELSGWLWIWKK